MSQLIVRSMASGIDAFSSLDWRSQRESRSGKKPEAGTAIFLGHRDPEPARLGHRAMKFEREHAVIVTRQPVVIAEACYDRAHTFPQRLIETVMVPEEVTK